MILGSNVVVLQLAQYSVGFRAGRDRVSEIWTCEKTQARQHCFDSKRIVTKRSPATFGLLNVACTRLATNTFAAETSPKAGFSRNFERKWPKFG